jgi:hypothetical protein
MQSNLNLTFNPYEPKMDNRFIIKFLGVDIPEYLFRKYEIYNEGEELIFTTEFIEPLHFTFNPKDIFNIISVEIKHLDPAGIEVSHIIFNVKGSNFEQKGDYSDGKLLINNFRFVIDKESMKVKNLIQEPLEAEYGK